MGVIFLIVSLTGMTLLHKSLRIGFSGFECIRAEQTGLVNFFKIYRTIRYFEDAEEA